MPEPLQELELATRREAIAVVQHPLFRAITNIAHVRLFMEHHVFAVWDFMALLKALQRGLTSVDSAWLPKGDARVRRLVNEIVLAEESDVDAQGNCFSHFELYLDAMDRAGADDRPIRAFTRLLSDGFPPRDALVRCHAPTAARAFVSRTLDIVEGGDVVAVAASFTLGREEIIPAMFDQLLKDLDRELPGRVDRLRFYLQRHIDLDGAEHGPSARRMLNHLCASDATRWRSATHAAQDALEARVRLWDGVLQAVSAKAELEVD